MSRALEEALEAVYGGDQSLEAGAVEDQLDDRGYTVVPFGFTYEMPDLRLPRRRWWPFGRRS